MVKYYALKNSEKLKDICVQCSSLDIGAYDKCTNKVSETDFFCTRCWSEYGVVLKERPKKKRKSKLKEVKLEPMTPDEIAKRYYIPKPTKTCAVAHEVKAEMSKPKSLVSPKKAKYVGPLRELKKAKAEAKPISGILTFRDDPVSGIRFLVYGHKSAQIIPVDYCIVRGFYPGDAVTYFPKEKRLELKANKEFLSPHRDYARVAKVAVLDNCLKWMPLVVQLLIEEFTSDYILLPKIRDKVIITKDKKALEAYFKTIPHSKVRSAHYICGKIGILKAVYSDGACIVHLKNKANVLVPTVAVAPFKRYREGLSKKDEKHGWSQFKQNYST